MTRLVRGLSAACCVTACVLAMVACSDDDDSTPGTPDSGTPDANKADTSPNGDSGLTDTGTDAGAPKRIVYTESNSITANMNSVMAFVQGDDGSLTPLPGSPFLTGGTGVSNPMQGLGPDDTDQEVMLSPDNTKLYAVNSGSDTIAVFDIASDGSLTAIAGSPFASGGTMPVSMGFAGSELFVVNQANDPLRPGVGTPNYVGMPITATGALGQAATPITAGKAPQVALTTPDGKLLFGVDFMAPLDTGANPLRSFAIGASGALTEATTSPMAIPVVAGGMPPGTPLALGLGLHPTQKILYANFVLRKEVGVYTYDDTGALTYITAATVSGGAPCWVHFNAAGTRAYVTDTGNNAVSVLDTTNPLLPTELQYLVLDDLGPLYDGGGNPSPTSQTYEESLSADGKYLFVLSQNTNPDLTQSTGNVLHVLSVGADGMVTETVPDVKLALGSGVRPQGVAVLR